MPGDVTLAVSGVQSTPLDYPIPGAAQLLLKALTANYNGSGAAGAFVPTVQLLIAGNVVVLSAPLGQRLAAGASADVSWFPWVGGSTTIVNNTGATTIDYAEITSAVFVTGTVGSPTPIVTGNSVTYDGATQVLIEFYTCQADSQGEGNIILSLWEDTTDLARLSQTDIQVSGVSDLGGPVYVARFLTPSAGTHVFSVRGWTTTPGSNPFVQAGTGSGGSGTGYMPAFMRISLADV